MERNLFIQIKALVPLACLLFLIITGHSLAVAEWESLSSRNAPVFITSDKLTVYMKTREFIYRGNVVLNKEDLHVTCGELRGRYGEDNSIEELIALKDVRITKGEKIKTFSQKAVYHRDRDLLELTENPRIEKEGGVLIADLVYIYLKENKTTAHGDVKVILDEELKE